MSDDRHARVSRRAYELWVEGGGEHGRDEEHWHRASREIAETVAAPDGTTLTVPQVAAEGGAAAKPARGRAAAKPVAPAAAKAPAKPRKPKAK